MSYHTPVLLQAVLEALKVEPGKSYLDATVGTGGHARAILEHGARVLGLDRDPEAINLTSRRLRKEIETEALVVVKANFDNLEQLAQQHGFAPVNGVLFDLGMSSWQLEESGRGFSFQKDEPLDMRMDPDLGVTAADLVNALGRKELEELLTKFGQVERARAVANAIIRARKQEKVTTTRQLVKIVARVVTKRKKIHPATKVMMALRITVNDELGNLERALPQAVRLLLPRGRLVVLSFHQGEDRIVKHFMKGEAGLELITKKPIRPTVEEIAANPRASSARLRVSEKLE